MKDNELFDLCKQVYEATKWQYELDWLRRVNIGLPSAYVDRVCYDPTDDEDDFLFELGEYGTDNAVPLYTSDYLLEKLPKYVTVKKVEYLLVLIPFPGGWIADYYRRYRPLDDFDSSGRLSWLHNAQDAQKCESDIPLKALLKLT